MQRPSGAAWAAQGRDSVHRRTGSNVPLSPLYASASSAFQPDGDRNTTSSSGSEATGELPAPLTRNGSTRHVRSPIPALSTGSLPHEQALRSGPSSTLHSPAIGGQDQPPVWKKVLYEKQPFDDNYVDAAFMQQLRTNTRLRALEFREIMRATFAILQQLNLVVLFTVTYAASLNGVISPGTLAAVDAALVTLSLVGYVMLTNGSFSLQVLFDPAKKTVVVTVLLLFLSPVFHTLTRSYSDDTIWALSILLGFIHVVFADYDYLNGQSFNYTHNLSMNAANVAVALLASRVADAVAAASIIGVGILVFTMSPILRHRIRVVSVDGHEASTLILCGIAIGCLVQLNPVLAAVFIVAVLVLAVAMPGFFVRVQSGQYKVQIQGPWDEAKPQNSAAAAEWATAGLLT